MPRPFDRDVWLAIGARYDGLQHSVAAAMPSWTPLFAAIAALVTDYGGVLSHGAIVAREYRIPAVVGTWAATKATMDGPAALVRSLSRLFVRPHTNLAWQP